MTDARQISDTQLQVVFETAVDAIIVINARGEILAANPAAEQLFGWAADTLIGQNVRILMPQPYRNEHDEYLENYVRTGERKIIGIGREVLGQRRDGTTFPVRLSVGEAWSSQNERLFVGIIHDLTEVRRSQEAFRDLAARMRTLIDTAVDGIVLIDAQGGILMYNRACERLFGYSADEVIGENVRMLVSEADRDLLEQEFANYPASDMGAAGAGREMAGRRKDGSTFPAHISLGETRETGERFFFGIIRDLTAAKRTEAQLVQAQKMEAVGQLAGGIAHDFNNLLTVIIGNADELLEKLRARPDLQRLAESICHAGERGAELTQRLLAFSRRQTLNPAPLDVNLLVQSILQLLRRTLRADIDIALQLDAGLWQATADPAQLESAILNLALNSQDAMPKGGTITISTGNVPLDEEYRDLHPEVKPGRYVMIAVTDNGLGMTEEVRAHAFEPFFTTKEVGQGTGLGLSMVYGFAKQSEGHVGIYSEPGLGTTVRIYLPVTRGAASVTEFDSEADEIQRGRGETVLVVEDDKFVRTFATSALLSLGYRILVATNAREGLEVLRAKEVDLLFTDIVMPGDMNGWELAKQALEMKPDLRVLVTSGYALESLSARGLIRPDFAFLTKPFRKPDLSRRVREVLDRPG